MEGNRTVDVLIPTYKPDQRCVQLVKRLLNQSVQVNRIYLIDTESGIFPKELYTISDRVKIHRILPEEFDHGGTRNLGAEMSDSCLHDPGCYAGGSISDRASALRIFV